MDIETRKHSFFMTRDNRTTSGGAFYPRATRKGSFNPWTRITKGTNRRNFLETLAGPLPQPRRRSPPGGTPQEAQPSTSSRTDAGYRAYPRAYLEGTRF